MSYAREELQWFFLNKSTSHLKSKGKKKSREDKKKGWEGRRVSELIHLLFQLGELVRDWRDMIDTYYTKFIKNGHLAKVEELLKTSLFTSCVGSDAVDALTGFVSKARDLTSDTSFEVLSSLSLVFEKALIV